MAFKELNDDGMERISKGRTALKEGSAVGYYYAIPIIEVREYNRSGKSKSCIQCRSLDLVWPIWVRGSWGSDVAQM
jgi:hypothetical protein